MINSKSSDCIFCKIVNKEIPSTCVFEDEYSYAFLDINPINDGHTLLIPKEHYENIHDIPDELLAKLAVHVKTLSGAIETAVDADGINIGMNNGSAAWQIVFHAHIHIIPRLEGDGFEPWGVSKKYTEDGESKTAKKITASLRERTAKK